MWVPMLTDEAVTPTMVANVEVFVDKDLRVTLQEVANQFRISKVSAHQILHEKNTRVSQ